MGGGKGDHEASSAYVRGLLAREGVAKVLVGLADRDAAWGFGWDLDLTAGWECQSAGRMPVLRRMVRGQRRPVAGILCLPPADEASEMVAQVVGAALDHVVVLRPGEYKV